MSRSTSPPQQSSFYPPNDVSTYRDLLLFEERLKTNVANLRRRKSRYQLFLVQLVLVISILLSDVVLDTAFLVLPLNVLLRRTWPDRPALVPHSYLTSGLLLIAITTLVLFFASGLYAEKIGYANRYVPHANRALRSFNIYLNVRPPPLRTSLNPLRYLFQSSSIPPPSPTQSSSSPTSSSRSTSPRRPAIPPIPPTSNPRGELIFSSRVDAAFREAYERYRAAFERKREERERAAAAARGGISSWLGFLRPPWRWRKAGLPQVQVSAHAAAASGGSGSSGLRDSGTPTPSSSRRSSPAPPGSRSASRGSLRRGKASRSGTPNLEAALPTKDKDRDRDSLRVENFTYLLAGQSEDPPLAGS